LNHLVHHVRKKLITGSDKNEKNVLFTDLDLSSGSGSANPKTGDTGVLLFIVMAALSAAAAAVDLKWKTVTRN
jgi:LPXTG-motif cell wall-anchored protein